MLAKMEIQRTPWTSIRTIDGNAATIGHALLRLLDCKSSAEAERIYWQLENRVVVQGQLFQAAEFVVPVILTALLENKARYIKISLLELLYQIVTGSPHEDEIQHGNTDLAEKCIQKTREGLWILYQEFLVGERESAQDILEIIDADRSRVDFFNSHLKS